MKKIVLVLMVGMLFLVGCNNEITVIEGSGNLENKVFKLDNFDKISSFYGYNVSVEKSNQFSVEITYDDNIADYLNISVNGDELNLSLNDDYKYRNTSLSAKIKMPDISSVSGAGSSKYNFVEGFKFDHNFEAKLSGNSTLSGYIETGDIDLYLNGNSNLNIKGSGKNLAAKLSGESTVNLFEFPITDSKIDMSGSSNIKINTDGRITVDGSGNSNLDFKGNGRIETQKLSGESKANKIN